MRIGPVTLTRTPPPPIDLAQNKRPVRIDSGEVGATGAVIFGGILGQTDYNPDLQPPLSYDIYDKMRKGDGQVRAALSAIKLPLLRAEWPVEPASDSAEDKEIAEFIEEGLQALSSSWQQTLRHILLHLDYGSMPFEKVWEVDSGDKRVHLRKLAPRLPRTISKWQLDDTGGIKAITQNAMRGGSMTPVDIPVEKLLLFVNELEGSDYRGQSLLRSAYKHWFFKDGLYRVDAIAKEKRSIGVDVMTLAGDNVTDVRRADAERALMRMRAHEKQFVVEVDGEVTYRTEGVGAGRALDALGSIEHHDLRIVRSVLAEFLAMGSVAAGSKAMHLDKTSFFLMALASTADYICDIFNSHLIPQWVDYNWTVKEYPYMTHSRLDTRDAKEIGDTVATLLGAGGLTYSRETEESLRELLELPEMPEEEELPDEQPIPIAAKRKPSNYERHVDFAALEDGLDKAERAIIASVRGVQKKQVATLLALAKGVFDKGNPEAVERVDVPFRKDVAAGVQETLRDLYKQGRKAAQQEFGRQGMSLAMDAIDPTDEPDVFAFLALRSRALASLMADRLKSTFVWEMLAQIRRGTYEPETLGTRLTDLSDREITKVAGFSITEALNLGRQSVADEHANEIDHAIFSSVLDTGTCGPCGQADGAEHDVGDTEYATPYRECDGSGQCRCVTVFVLKGETPASV